MKKWYVKTDNEKNYVIFEEDNSEAEFNDVAFGMCMNNNIPCLIPCSVSRSDNKRIIMYNVSSYQTMQELLENETSFDLISSLFIDMCSSIIMLRRYMIDTNSLIFDTDKIYVDTLNAKAKFLIYPLNEKRAVDLRDIFRNIIVKLKLNKQDSKNVGEILSMLNKNKFSAETFLADMKDPDRNKNNGHNIRPVSYAVKTESDRIPSDRAENSAVMSNFDAKENDMHIPAPDPVRTENNKDNKKNGSLINKLFAPKKKTVSKAKSSSMDGLNIPGKENANTKKNITVLQNTSDTDVTVPADDVTAILTDMDQYPKLRNKTTNETVTVDKDMFKIGRDASLGLDMVINQKLVSHYHASIRCKNGAYYIIDENSTNHVFVNGQKIPVNDNFRLNDGDVIKIGSEEFVFEL